MKSSQKKESVSCVPNAPDLIHKIWSVSKINVVVIKFSLAMENAKDVKIFKLQSLPRTKNARNAFL